MDIERRHQATSWVIDISGDDDLSDAPIFFGPYSSGIVEMPAAIDACSLGFKVSTTEDGTPLPLYDDEGTLIQISGPAVDKAYIFPDKLFPGLWVWLWSQNGSGSNTAQTADRTFPVHLKG